MGGTREGGQRAAQTNKERYGEDYYKRLGRIGGMVGRTGGFYANRDLARIAGAVGGTVSRRKGQALPPKRRRSIDAERRRFHAHIREQRQAYAAD